MLCAAAWLGVSGASWSQAPDFNLRPFENPGTDSGGSPFAVEVRRAGTDDAPELELTLRIPPGHRLYADDLVVRSGDRVWAPTMAPEPVRKADEFFDGAIKAFYISDTTMRYPWPGGGEPIVVVEFMGCDETTCFLPETQSFRIRADGTSERAEPPDANAEEAGADLSGAGWAEILESRFTLRARGEGMMRAPEFLKFLGATDVSPADSSPASGRGWLLTLLGVIVGGLALNLTPCVLPMIPINLAIIGAGSMAGSRRRGFVLGGIYGLAIAVSYGALGVVAVLTQATFGSLNANPWFNAAMCVLFIVLAAAMMGLFSIDLSRFQSGLNQNRPGRGPLALAFFMGVVAALLAGACVAPALISVLVLAGRLYTDGNPLGLVLPFLLGLGMALPWPFAGAGLSFLPKPGRWMNLVKYGFGILILGFALYYGRLAYSLFRPAGYDPAAEERRLAEGAARALREGRPLFVDFWANWCKNCMAMEKTTFQDPEVRRRLDEFVVVKYQAERPDREPAKSTLRHLGIQGLPVYLIYDPKE
ncbi:MAG: thioredoxin family protein [Kiritimatiellae bacterium]|nr:thioredoxin family protein [Kiritimatiellia bacterium]